MKPTKTDQGIRVYEGKIPSVTTILSHKSGAFNFEQWRKLNPVKAKEAQTRGTTVHSLIEHYLLDDPAISSIKVTDECLGYFSAFVPTLDKIKSSSPDKIEVEKYCKHEDTGLAFGGTSDCVLYYPHSTILVDWKTCSSSPSKSSKDKWAAQAAAYAKACKADRARVFYVVKGRGKTPTYRLKTLALESEDLERHYAFFRYKLIEFYKSVTDGEICLPAS